MKAVLLGRSKDACKVNYFFGEGVNPLMRKIREGFTHPGLAAKGLRSMEQANCLRCCAGIQLRRFSIGTFQQAAALDTYDEGRAPH